MTERRSIDREAERCSICMNDMYDKLILKCGHKFHHLCIKELFCIYLSDKCPLCRDKFSYQPSKKRKSKRNLRKKILKINTNIYGVMERQKCADLYYYFHSRGVKMPFLIKMIKRLTERCDYNYIKYTIKFISLHKGPIPNTEKRILYYSNEDRSKEDEDNQEILRRELHPYDLDGEIKQQFSDTYNVTLEQVRYMHFLDPDFDLNNFVDSLNIPDDCLYVDEFIGREFIRILHDEITRRDTRNIVSDLLLNISPEQRQRLINRMNESEEVEITFDELF